MIQRTSGANPAQLAYDATWHLGGRITAKFGADVQRKIGENPVPLLGCYAKWNFVIFARKSGKSSIPLPVQHNRRTTARPMPAWRQKRT